MWTLIGCVFFLNSFCPILVNAQYEQTAKKDSFINERPAQITGKIANYKANDNNRLLTFRTYSISGKIKDTAIFIDNDGFFKVDLIQDFEGDITLLYQKADVDLYSIPGERLHIEIDEVKWIDPKTLITSISLSGKAAVLSKLIGAFTKAYMKEQFSAVKWEDSSISDEEAASLRIERLREEEAFLRTYLKKNAIKNVHFENWAENYMGYKAGFDIAFESFSSLRKKSMTIEQLMKVLKRIKVENPAALHNSSYYSFLKMLQSSFQIIVNINPLYKEIVKSNGLNPIPVYAQFIDHYSSGVSKQLMYYDLFMNHPRGNYTYLFNNVILEVGLKKRFETIKNQSIQPFVPFNVIERLNSTKVDSSIKKRLMTYFESRSDSFLFIDFWGTWCHPCLKEMPFYNQLISKFQGVNIQFIFLAALSEEGEVLKVKEKHGILGDFVVLNDNEVKILNNIFQFNSYPSHFLLAPNGIVIGNKLPHISSGTNLDENVVEMIKKLVKE